LSEKIEEIKADVVARKDAVDEDLQRRRQFVRAKSGGIYK
jgi:hypothetical protein